MSICVASAGSVLTLLAGSFSLSWTHSVEKTEWIEHWQVVGEKLALTSAKVEGSGAGIDLPPDAKWEDGGWTYRPAVPPQSQINLAASGATGGGWSLCTNAECSELGAESGATTSIWIADTCTDPTPSSADRAR